MVLCEVCRYVTDDFVVLYSIMGMCSVFLVIVLMAAPTFYYLYMKATYETWRWKTIKTYPPAEIVAMEIIQSTVGALVTVVMPVAAIWLSQRGLAMGYCGLGRYGWWYDVWQLVLIVVVSDWWQWFYHYVGHCFASTWKKHAYHHKFYNVSPFAVTADGAVDSFFHGVPLLLFPVVMHTNLDIMFFTYVILFVAYGTYLHSGHGTVFLFFGGARRCLAGEMISARGL